MDRFYIDIIAENFPMAFLLDLICFAIKSSAFEWNPKRCEKVNSFARLCVYEEKQFWTLLVDEFVQLRSSHRHVMYML